MSANKSELLAEWLDACSHLHVASIVVLGGLSLPGPYHRRLSMAINDLTSLADLLRQLNPPPATKSNGHSP